MTYVIRNAVIDPEIQFENTQNDPDYANFVYLLVQLTFSVTTIDKTVCKLLYSYMLEKAPVAQLDRATDF